MKLILMILLIPMPLLAGSLSGQVTRSDTDQPVTGAVIMARGTNNSTTTDAAGHYFLDIPDGFYGLVCSASGLVGQASGAQQISGATEIDFALDPPGLDSLAIQGTAYCRSQLCVDVLVLARSGDSLVGAAISASDGSYAILGLSAGEYSILGTALGYWPATEWPVSAGQTGIDLYLVASEDLFTISGVVGLSDNPTHRDDSTVTINGHSQTTTTDFGGEYRLEQVPAGLLSLTATRPGYTSRTIIDVEVFRDTTLNFVISRNENIPGIVRYRLAGSVTLENAEAAQGARVSIWSESGSFQKSAITDSEGNYQIEAIPAGNYQAGAALEGYFDDISDPFEMSSNQTMNFSLSSNPDYDWGPGEDQELQSCSCSKSPGPFGIGTILLAFFIFGILMRKKWSF
jgi:hypothetical protein